MIDRYIDSLVAYGSDRGLITQADLHYVRNALLERLHLDSYTPSQEPLEQDLTVILRALTDYAVQEGIIEDDITLRDLFDTALMGCLTPRPSEVQAAFFARYETSPKLATDYFYQLSRDTDYIRTDRIAKNLCWKADTEYGQMDITVNLSKPEKPTTSLAAFKAAKDTGYPKCLLCLENEGYAGRYNHPARQNHRVIPLTLGGEQWYLQYSPYVYYNEHCIAFSGEHTPMRIDRNTFVQLLDFVTLFPHYFMGSNAELPVVGGSIFTHEHFQGGRYTFALEKAPVETAFSVPGFEAVRAGIVRWPMSVIRLQSADREALAALADRILTAWRGYTDESAFVFAETDGIAHNTVTPIARRCGEDYVMDLVLRNNITTEEHPLGYFHPHAELHHIKKENIGLIEVLGLAVLPPRLKKELAKLREQLLNGTDPAADPDTEKHAAWAYALQKKYTFTPENAEDILRREVGSEFAAVLEHAGVFKRTQCGKDAFLRFVRTL